MWVQRTPEEVQKWHDASAREARNQGLLFAGLTWLAITVVLSGGWIASGRMGFIAQESVATGSFWTRFPVFALVGVPVAFWLFRRECRTELDRSSVGSSRVDLQACKLEYSIVSPK